MRLPNTEDEDSDYDDEACDEENEIIKKQRSMNKIPEESEEEDMDAMMAENMRLREHLRKIKADKELQDEAQKEVEELKEAGPVSDDSSDIEANNKFD